MTSWKNNLSLGVPKLSEWPKVLFECLAEFLGTFIIVFFGVGSVLSPALGANDMVQISLAFGLAVFVGAEICGPISGGYMNPAVALAGFVTGRLALVKMVLYMFFQCIGAIVAALVLKLLTPSEQVENRSLGMNLLQSVPDSEETVTEAQGLIMEILATAIFVQLILRVTEASEDKHWSPPLSIGLTVTLCHVLLIPYTGCSVNPARSLGPAVIQANFENHWIFWVGPLLGGLCAGIHHLIVEKLQSKKTEVQAAPENKTEEGIENPAVSMTSIVP